MKIPIRMKAALYKTPAQPLELAEVPTPTPGEGEVLVKVAAAGVCHSDLHILDGEMIPPPEGFILARGVWLGCGVRPPL